MLNSNLVIPVEYEYMNADQVDALKKRVRSSRLWKSIEWGNFGRNGITPLAVKTLDDCETDHLEAILITQPQISPEIRASILELLKQRHMQTKTNPFVRLIWFMIVSVILILLVRFCMGWN